MIFTFILQIPTPTAAGLAHIDTKERDKKERHRKRKGEERDQGN